MTRGTLPLSGAAAIAFPVAGGTTDPVAVARLALCGAALGAIAAIDLREHRVPNRLVLPAAGACAGLSVIGGVSAPALLTGLAIVAGLFVVAVVHPAALGMGDVKLSLLIVVGLDGDASGALAVGLVLAALAGLLTIARSGAAAGRRTLPLGPFLALASLLVLLP